MFLQNIYSRQASTNKIFSLLTILHYFWGNSRHEQVQHRFYHLLHRQLGPKTGAEPAGCIQPTEKLRDSVRIHRTVIRRPAYLQQGIPHGRPHIVHERNGSAGVMTDKAKNTILDAKYASIISVISEMYSIPWKRPLTSSTTPRLHALSKKVSPTYTAAATATLRKRSGGNTSSHSPKAWRALMLQE